MHIVITAKSPIVHGEFSDGLDVGNMLNFRRMPILHNGNTYDVPVISGNAIRGTIRRLLSREIVDTFDLKNAMGKSFDKFYIAISNGGNLDKNMDVAVDTQKLRNIRSNFPLLSVIGAALYKYMLPGMCNIGFAIPRCTELGTGVIRLSDITSDVGLTRHIDKTEANPEDAKPMPYTVETVISGTVFDVEISFAPQATEVEQACINHGLKLLHTIGGRAAAGFGMVQADGYGDDAKYLEWIENKKNIDFLVAFAEGL